MPFLIMAAGAALFVWGAVREIRAPRRPWDPPGVDWAVWGSQLFVLGLIFALASH